MMAKWRKILTGVLFVACIFPVVAEARNLAAGYHLTENASATNLSEEQAIKIVKQHIKGRVLAIDLADQIYRIKILDHQGAMRVIQISAADGMILSTH